MARWNPEAPVMAQGLAPLTPKQLIDAERDCVYIFNVAPREHRIQASSRWYIVPARAEGAEVSPALKIPGTVFGEEFKRTTGICTNEFSRIQEDGEDVASRILGLAPFCKPDQNLVRWGCFMTSNSVPTEREIESATDHFHERCNELVNEARGFYSINNGMVALTNGRMVSNIAEQHRMAAKELGIAASEPWAAKTVQMSACPACGVPVRVGVAFCPNGDIIDEAKARVARPWLFAEEKRGPGRPPRVEALA